MEIKTGLTNCQILRDLLFPISNQKNIFFRNYKKFDETKLLTDLKNVNFCFTSVDPNENYLSLTN